VDNIYHLESSQSDKDAESAAWVVDDVAEAHARIRAVVAATLPEEQRERAEVEADNVALDQEAAAAYAEDNERAANERATEAENADPEPACSCGWDGEVDPAARGQRCPDCGQWLS